MPQQRLRRVGTGSEVALCIEAYEALAREGLAARVVSMPSWELFDAQDQAYGDHVLAAVRNQIALNRDRPS